MLALEGNVCGSASTSLELICKDRSSAVHPVRRLKVRSLVDQKLYRRAQGNKAPSLWPAPDGN